MQAGKAAEPPTSEVTQPLVVVPEAPKPADTPAADTNGAASGVNGTGDNIQPLVPEVSKQSNAPAVDSSANKTPAPDSAPTTSDAIETPTESGQPAVMTGALPLGGQSNQGPALITPIESMQDDGVKDVPATATKTPELGANGTDKKDRGEGASSADIAPGAAVAEKKDVDMKDVAPVESESSSGSSEQKDVDMKDTAPAPATASSADGTGAPGTSGAVSATNGEGATGEKRKAEAGANGTATNEEPAEKKHKGLADKAASKAKEVVEEVKEKATPARKNSKKGKKEQAPVGRTERKTRSQGRAE